MGDDWKSRKRRKTVQLIGADDRQFSNLIIYEIQTSFSYFPYLLAARSRFYL